jgi:hypothetical protein
MAVDAPRRVVKMWARINFPHQLRKVNQLYSILAWWSFASFLVLAPAAAEADNTTNNNHYYTSWVCH